MAPRRESMRLPINPAMPPRSTTGSWVRQRAAPPGARGGEARATPAKYAAPMARPPARLNTRPAAETAPFVPRGTRLKLEGRY